MHLLTMLRHLASGGRAIIATIRERFFLEGRPCLLRCGPATWRCRRIVTLRKSSRSPTCNDRMLSAALPPHCADQPSSRLYQQLDKLLLLSQVPAWLARSAACRNRWPALLPAATATAAACCMLLLLSSPAAPLHPLTVCLTSPPLRQGHVLYWGGAAAAAAWFAGLGYPLPYGSSLADFLLDLASGDVATEARCALLRCCRCSCFGAPARLSPCLGALCVLAA